MNDYTRISRNKKDPFFRFCKTISKELFSSNRKAKGYSLLEIVGLSDRSNAPLPVYSKVLSNEKPDFVSEPEEILTALKHLTSFVGNRGIRTLDRGFDSLTYIRYFVSQKQSFLLRATKKRLIVHRGKTKNILSLARSY